jgi:SAM-dependent methyltransferase
MMADADRQEFHLELVRLHVPDGGTVVDLGGGVGLFSPAVAAAGYRSVLVDDFSDPINIEHGEGLLFLHKELGVEIENRDVLVEGIDFPPRSIDLVTAFETMEHWHHSPKKLFRQVLDVLKPGGAFIIACPNNVSIRRRVTVPLGRGSWSSMLDWYEQPVFRGHVREPNVSDLRYIARDLGLSNVQVLGRNWRMYRAAPLRLAAIADHFFRPFPSLCTDLYIIGRKHVHDDASVEWPSAPARRSEP